MNSRIPSFSGQVALDTVLVVDDEQSIRTVAAQALTRAGFHVLQASSSQQALELSRGWQGQLLLLLTDVLLPGMNGARLAETLRIERPELRVIFMSGYEDDPVLRNEILQSSAIFLPKPFEGRKLVELARRVVGAPQVAAQR